MNVYSSFCFILSSFFLRGRTSIVGSMQTISLQTSPQALEISILSFELQSPRHIRTALLQRKDFIQQLKASYLNEIWVLDHVSYSFVQVKYY